MTQADILKDKMILLGVSGGIAAYKACELVRLLVLAEAEVHVMMTTGAQKFVTPLSFQALSGRPCHTELFDLTQEQEIGHIALADRADVVVIAPATADVIAKFAHGLADDLVSTVLLATRAPVLIVPAMNVNMWEHQATRRNVQTLRDFGYQVLEPATGSLACGWNGKGRLPDPSFIQEQLINLLSSRSG